MTTANRKFPDTLGVFAEFESSGRRERQLEGIAAAKARSVRAAQRPLPDQTGRLGRIEEIVRRGGVRGFVPWLITQRPAVVHKTCCRRPTF
jgi:DNA invertase Pin-like site-specific DNA recombinase